MAKIGRASRNNDGKQALAILNESVEGLCKTAAPAPICVCDSLKCSGVFAPHRHQRREHDMGLALAVGADEQLCPLIRGGNNIAQDALKVATDGIGGNETLDLLFGAEVEFDVYRSLKVLVGDDHIF